MEYILGDNWNQPEVYFGKPFSYLASGATGQFVSGTVSWPQDDGGGIYLSSDYGNTFAPAVGDFNFTTNQFAGIAMSADAKYQFATVEGDRVYGSSNGGANWVAVDIQG